MNCNVENGRQEAAEIKKIEKPKPAKTMPKATARIRPQDGIAKPASKKATSNVSYKKYNQSMTALTFFLSSCPNPNTEKLKTLLS